MAKKKTGKRKAEASDSDSDMSVNIITESKPRLKSSLKKPKTMKRADNLEEEDAYQKRFQWLQDRGDDMADAATEKSDNESVDSSSEEE